MTEEDVVLGVAPHHVLLEGMFNMRGGGEEKREIGFLIVGWLR